MVCSSKIFYNSHHYIAKDISHNKGSLQAPKPYKKDPKHSIICADISHIKIKILLTKRR